jgi:hypothetical protein
MTSLTTVEPFVNDAPAAAQLAPAAPASDALLAEHVTEIHQLRKRSASDIAEIGRRLVECKDIVGYGNWSTWLAQNFEWDERTALNFVRVYELAGKSEKFSDLNIPVSALYLLAAPSTPAEVQEEIIGQAEGGKVIQLAEVKKAIKVKKRGKSDPDAPEVQPTMSTKERAAFAGTRDRAAELGYTLRRRGGGFQLTNKEGVDEHFDVLDGVVAELDRVTGKWHASVGDECAYHPQSRTEINTEAAREYSAARNGNADKPEEIGQFLEFLGFDRFFEALKYAPKLKARLALYADLERTRPKPDKSATNLLRKGLGTRSPAEQISALGQLNQLIERRGLTRNAVQVAIGGEAAS